MEIDYFIQLIDYSYYFILAFIIMPIRFLKLPKHSNVSYDLVIKELFLKNYFLKNWDYLGLKNYFIYFLN